MTLEYLWIEDFKCIKRQGFNFGGEYLFRIDTTRYNDNSLILSTKKNETFIKDFYNAVDNPSSALISNITAIVGKNGAGKTTIFDFIKQYFPDGEGEIDVNCLIITKDNTGVFTAHSYNTNKIEVIQESEFIIGVVNYPIDKSMRVRIPNSKPFKDLSIIFFSNIFDQRNEIEIAGLYNISTNYLIKSALIKAKENKSPQAEFTSEVQMYHNVEIEKQLRLISYFQKKGTESYLPFDLPDKLIIEASTGRKRKEIVDEIIRNYEQQKLSNLKNFTSMITVLEGNIELVSQYREDQHTEMIVIPLMSELIIHTLYCIFHYSIGYVKPYTERIRNIVYENLTKVQVLKRIISTLKSIFPPFLKHFENLSLLLEHALKAVSKKELAYWSMTNRLVYQINKSTYGSLSKFLRLYFQTQIIEGGLKFYWGGMSSGQIAILNLYSRLHYLIDSQYETHLDKEDVLLLLDEPEVYLHPEWQRCFLENLIKFLLVDYAYKSSSQSSKQRKIQVLFSTNNPLTLSDLLPNNVVRLERLNNGRETHISDNFINQESSTFAANLYNLLDDAFFFDNEYIGSYAKIIIDQIMGKIMELEKTNTDQPVDFATMSYIEQVISAIGEPVIRSYLSMRLESAVNKSDGHDEFLSKLKQCINKVKKVGDKC